MWLIQDDDALLFYTRCPTVYSLLRNTAQNLEKPFKSHVWKLRFHVDVAAVKIKTRKTENMCRVLKQCEKAVRVARERKYLLDEGRASCREGKKTRDECAFVRHPLYQ